MNPSATFTRRTFLAGAATMAANASLRGEAAAAKKAQIVISLDLEMSRDYPRRGMSEWDFDKGNLDDATKQYAVEAARRVRAHGGQIHFFCVARVLEQPDVTWLKRLAAEGHLLGNHTYDHVNVKAATPEEAQFRFQRAPWLVRGKTALEVIRENIRLASLAMQERLGVPIAGFRTPGGFGDGLTDRPDLQHLALDLGFTWVSSLYPPHERGAVGEPPTAAVIDSIVAAQKAAQPFAYPCGLVEVPMSPISDVTAFRSQRWKLPDFLTATRAAVGWAIDAGATFDFLAHPSCLVVEDPNFEAIELICRLVQESSDRAEFSTLDQLAQRARPALRAVPKP
jgi:peptidoglycan/xylan/chitin deacetylase (PgdA/CDA1 family)